jgi:Flp pilus assembly protein TadD
MDVARKALDLDPTLGEAHMTRALFSWRYEWDWKAADREFEYAIALAPSNDTIRCYHSNYLAWRRRRDEAVAELTKSRELNPGASFSASESSIYFQMRDYAGLVRVSQNGVHSDPNEWLEHFFLGMGYEGIGQRAEAIPEYQRAVELSGGDQDPTAALAHAYAMTGRTEEARTILRELEQKRGEYVSPYMIATIHAGLGDKDRAFEYLTKAFQEKCLDIAWQLKADHRIDTLRADPRFDALLRQVNFP